MCGILGSVGFRHIGHNELNQMIHRGPDDHGEFSDVENLVYLGHRRLSIIDLSHAGCQPMTSDNGCFHITYNGEIYNFLELKKQYFPNKPFKSKTDTEVLLNLYSQFGHSCPKYLRENRPKTAIKN